MPLVEYEDYIAEPEEKYNESDDEDFNPESAPPEDASSSSDEDNAIAKPQRNGKRKAPLDEDLDSGDEVTIKQARRKKSKKQKKGKKGGDDEEAIFSDGEGGLIKTRAQRRVEQVERRPLARTKGATVDVDALWAQMTAAPLAPVQPARPQEVDPQPTTTTTAVPKPISAEEEEQIQISKTYTFAGQDTTEEKSIPRSHLPKYTSDGWTPISPTKSAEPDTTKHKANTSKIRRPLRRPSRFDPNPTGYARTLPPEHQLTYPRATASLAREIETTMMPPPDLPAAKSKDKAQKLNVVDKSRMDWTGFVDKEGIGEELDMHGKTKEAYLGRMLFLDNVAAKGEQKRKEAKLKGMVGSGMG